MHQKDKQKVLVEVQSRIREMIMNQARVSSEPVLDHLIHEVIYFEDDRLRNGSHLSNVRADKAWLSDLRQQFQTSSERGKRQILSEIIDRHSEEVIGHFSDPVYHATTKVIPIGLGMMLNALSPLKLFRSFPNLPDVADNVIIQGETEQMKALKKKGTYILAPTHLSNLDSLILGYSIYKLGLPPVTYGAGINLFEHKFLGFFMHRLGAYKVDRQKRHSLYKAVLKEYANVTLENGYDNLFFPGGTRARSGAVERKLKLGLLGAGIKAYFNNLKKGKKNPKIFIIPCTLNYQLVLEAENLIEDHLKAAGKSRYIIVDDEFSMPSRIYSFMRNLVSLDEKICLTISKALDPFGNQVDIEGNSLDGRGRPIDIERYFYRDGELHEDPDRDAQFTRELGKKVSEAYMRDNVIFPGHILAWTVFEKLRELYPDQDFYRFLRTGCEGASLPMVDVYKDVERTIVRVENLAQRGKLRISLPSDNGRSEAVVNNALKLFGCYHTKPVVERKGDRLFPVDMNLLYYYRNRLWGYGLEKIPG